MKKKVNNSINSDANDSEMPKKERHIVSWSQEEDEVLRDQIRVHGTENWAIIASEFKDKTTRQCRRRWFTYLNLDFKKGGWSSEEDMLLCEAQKIFGNRWTEIAKVVSGRTDNAVKNRFATLCKKRAKHEALAKANSTISYINLSNKRVIFPNGLNTDGGSKSSAPLKKIRTYISNIMENCNQGEKIAGECGVTDNLLRSPFVVLAQNFHCCEGNFPNQLHVSHIKGASIDESVTGKVQGTFLKKDDPKVLALMQQAELLSSLAIKVNSEKSNQSVDSAWTVLQDFLQQNKESDLLTLRNSDEFQLEKFQELMEDLSSSSQGSRQWRQLDKYESSPDSSEYSTGSTVLPYVPCDKAKECQTEICVLLRETGYELRSVQSDVKHFLAEENEICHTPSTHEVKSMLICDDIKANNEAICKYSNTEFSSPLHVTPLFKALAAAIPSPRFSESEKHFLMKTLGMESPAPNPISNPSQPPLCKKSLLHYL